MKISGRLLGSLLLASAIPGCSRSDAQEPTLPASVSSAPPYTECREPRPEICYEVYAPVCATRDTGISTEQAVYPNDCTACSDPKVSGYRPGKCPSVAGTP